MAVPSIAELIRDLPSAVDNVVVPHSDVIPAGRTGGLAARE